MKKFSLLKVRRDVVHSRLYIFRTPVYQITPNSLEINIPIPFGLTRFGFKKEVTTEQLHIEAIKKEPFDFACVQRAQAFAMDILSKSERVNKKHSSYGLKHIAERFFERHFGISQNTYVANGDFILAMFLCEYKISIEKNSSPNCFFNISETSISNAETHKYGISEDMKVKFQKEGIYDVF